MLVGRNIVWRVWRHQRNQLIVLLTIFQLLLVELAGAGEITCHGIRYTYYNKGLDVADVPKSPQQGRQTHTTGEKFFLMFWIPIQIRIKLRLYYG
jgi:hypothetical protein